MAVRKRGAGKKADALTPRDALFVAEYLKCLDPKKAALAAGFSETVAKSKAYQWVSNGKAKPLVFAAVEKGRRKVIEKLEVTADDVRDELRKIGFSNIRKAVRWRSGVEHMVEDTEGLMIRATVNEVQLVDSDDLDDDTAAAIQSISQSNTGALTLKMYDKRAALVDLGKHLGMFKDQLEITGDPVTFTIVHTERAKRAG